MVLADAEARRYAIVIVHPDGREYCDRYHSLMSEAERTRRNEQRSVNPGIEVVIRDGAEVFAKIGGDGFGWIPKGAG